MSSLTLYSFEKSGHAHRARLMLSLLNLDAEIYQVDLANGEHKSEKFLQKNIFGQVPVLLDGTDVISDSNAILIYLVKKYAPGSHWLPEDIKTQAEIQRFLSIAAGPIAYGPAAARLVTVFGAPLEPQQLIARAHEVLFSINSVLSKKKYLTGNEVTIADIANYSYIKHAPEGNVSLEDYPHIRNWLARIEKLPGFIAMPETKVGLAA